jgi:hypothetical protein
VSLVDLIEEQGIAVEVGLVDRAAAIQRVVEFSDGGLTRFGAEGLLDNWQTTRARYADEFMRAEMALAALQARRGES